MNVQIMSLDMNSLRPPQTASKARLSKKEDNFSSFLEKSRDKQEPPSQVKAQKKQENVAKAEPETKTSQVKTSETKKNQEPKEVSKAPKEEDLATEGKTEQTIEAIASLLGISSHALEDLLASLQIGLSDLLEADHLQALMMQVHKVEEPMDLLAIPELVSEIKGIASILAEQGIRPVETKSAQVEIELAQAPVQTVIGQGQELDTGEKVEAQGQNLAAQKNPELKDLSEKNQNPKTLEADSSDPAKAKVLAPSDENLAQNQDQFTPNQNNTANEFLNNLSESLSQAFQSQNDPIVDASKSQATRNPVVDPRMVLDQVVEKIKASAIDNDAQMSIQLKPEHLGKLSMEVISKQGIMTAQFIVENEKTKEILEQNIQSLRESLEDKGLVIEKLEVTVGQNQEQNQEAYAGSGLKRNTSAIINRMMNQEIWEEEPESEDLFKSDTNEVDYIA